MSFDRVEVTEKVLENLSLAIRDSGRSEEAISEGIGRNPGWLRDQIQSGTVPNLVDFYLIAEQLGVDIKDMLPGDSPRTSFTDKVQSEFFSAKGFDGPEPHDVLKWHVDNRGYLRNHDWLLDHVELFREPDRKLNQLCPERVGRSTIVACVLGLKTTEEVRDFVAQHDEKDRKAVVQEHADILSSNRVSIMPRVYEYQIAPGHHAKVEFLRLLLPVRSEDDEMFVMNFSKPLKFSETIENVGAKTAPTGDPALTEFKVL